MMIAVAWIAVAAAVSRHAQTAVTSTNEPTHSKPTAANTRPTHPTPTPAPCPRSLPSERIRVFARGDGSGTTVLVTSYLRKACPQQWSQEAANRLDWPAGVNVVRRGCSGGLGSCHATG